MKEEKYHIYLTDDERQYIIKSLLHLKNELIRQDRYADAVDDVICKLIKARKKKLKIKYI